VYSAPIATFQKRSGRSIAYSRYAAARRLKISRNHMARLDPLAEVEELPERPEGDETEREHSEQQHVILLSATA
jgi:hypothetical protein